MTKTFANREELMIALLQGEKWYNEHNNIAIVFYDKSSKDVPFKIKVGRTGIFPIISEYDYCDSKTLWTKVEEKTELDLMKEKYASGDYILTTPNKTGWLIVDNPRWDCDNYKLIHKKHKDILDAYLADNSVEINYPTDLPNNAKELSFVDNYNENVDYHLVKPKKKTISLAMFTCQQTMDTDWMRPAVFETLEDFKKRHWADYFINHHEIPNTRYEQEIDE